MAKKKRKEPAAEPQPVAAEPQQPEQAAAPSELSPAEPTPAQEAPQLPALPAAADQPTRDNPYPDPAKPYSIAHHNGAGVRLLKFPRFKQVQLRFEREVPPEVQKQLEQDHWKFRPEEGVYTKQYGPDGEAAAIVQARRLYGELCSQFAMGASR